MTPVQRLENQLTQLRADREAAKKDGGWTAVSNLSALEDKTLAKLLALEAEAEEAAEQEEAEMSAEEVLDAIVEAAMDLPSYMVDTLIARLEETRECEPASDWMPG